MSFQGLISGAECSTAFNPLSQVLKHTEGDRSLQQDRNVGSSSSRLHQLPGTSMSTVNEQDIAHARQFFDGSVPQNQHHMLGFRPGGISSAELSRLAELRGSPVANEPWVMEQHSREQAIWANEFKPATPQMNIPPSSSSQNLITSQDLRQNSYMPMMSNGVYNMGMMNTSQPMYQSYQSFSSPPLEQQSLGKGKGKEADFDAAFAQAAASLESSSRFVEVDDIEAVGETLKGVSLDGKADTLQQLVDQVPNAGSSLEEMANWEAQFNQMMASDRDDTDQDYTGLMQEAWESGIQQDPLGEMSTKFNDDGIPILADYVFESNNDYMDPSSSNRSLLADAKMLLEQNGSLTEAALLLEAAIQKGELGEGGYEAWILLGETRNMDEREEAGMKALMEGVKRAEAAGAKGDGMLSLAISFTNESYDRASFSMLLNWVRNRYPDHPIPEVIINAVKSHSTWDTQEKITNVFLDIARKQHMQGVLDADLQIGLGVLFYTNQVYDKAKDCFEAALSVRPKDYLLWNRLGSCLSNGNKPEEALGAYREALNLRPTYTRAVYNVGVACLNIGAHKEAAEHFLSALALQESNSGETSEQLWFTLRRALLMMDRSDLAGMAKAESRPDLELFRKEGFDF